jgi:hypothetical protein
MILLDKKRLADIKKLSCDGQKPVALKDFTQPSTTGTLRCNIFLG